MPKKKWDNDGPRRSAQGYGWDWRYLQTIMMMSAASDVARKEVKVWWNFLDSHPDIKEDLRRDVLESNLSRDKIVERLKDLIKRFNEEQQRRQRIMKEQLK